MELSLKNSLFSPERGCVYFSYGSTILGGNILHHFSASFFITLQTSSQLLCGACIIPCDTTLSLCGLKCTGWTFKREFLPVTRTTALQGMKEEKGAHWAAAGPPWGCHTAADASLSLTPELIHHCPPPPAVCGLGSKKGSMVHVWDRHVNKRRKVDPLPQVSHKKGHEQRPGESIQFCPNSLVSSPFQMVN